MKNLKFYTTLGCLLFLMSFLNLQAQPLIGPKPSNQTTVVGSVLPSGKIVGLNKKLFKKRFSDGGIITNFEIAGKNGKYFLLRTGFDSNKNPKANAIPLKVNDKPQKARSVKKLEIPLGGGSILVIECVSAGWIIGCDECVLVKDKYTGMLDCLCKSNPVTGSCKLQHSALPSSSILRF